MCLKRCPQGGYVLKRVVGLKVVSVTFLLVCFLSLKESTCETRKNLVRCAIW